MSENAEKSPSETVAEQATSSRPRKKWRRRLLRTLIVLIALLLALALFTPTLISTGPGRGLALAVVNANIPGRVQLQQLSVGWWSGVSLGQVTLFDPDGAMVAQLHTLDAPEATLLKVLRGRQHYGVVQAGDLKAHVVQYDDGTTNLSRVFALPQEPATRDAPRREGKRKPAADKDRGDNWLAGLNLQLDLREVHLTYEAPRLPQVTLTSPGAKVILDSLTDIRAQFTALVQQQDASGRIDVDLALTELFDPTGSPQWDRGRIEADVNLTHLPVDVIDRILQQEGRLVSLLGSPFDGRIQARGDLSSFDATITATAPHLEAMARASARQTDTGAMFTLEVGTPVRLRATQDAWAQWTRNHSMFAGTRLTRPVDLLVTIDQVELPWERQGQGGRLRWDLLAGEIRGEMSDAMLDMDGMIGHWRLRNTWLAVVSRRLGATLEARLEGRVDHGQDEAGAFDVHVHLRDLGDAGGLSMKNVQADLVATLVDLPLFLADQFMRTGQLISTVMGSRLNARIDAQLAADERGPAGVRGTFTVAGKTETFDSLLTGNLAYDAVLVSEGSFTNLTLKPGALGMLAGQYVGLPEAMTVRTDETSNIRIDFEAMRLPLLSAKWRAVEFGARVFVDHFTPLGVPRLEGSHLRNVRLHVPYTSMEDPVLATMETDILFGDQAGRMTGRAAVTSIFNEDQAIESQFEILDLPVALLDKVAGGDGLLGIFLGPVLDVTRINVDSRPGEPDAYDLQATMAATDLGVKLHGRYTVGRELALDDESVVLMGVTPEAFERWQAMAGVQHADPSQRLALVDAMAVNLALSEVVVAMLESPAPSTEPSLASIDPARSRLKLQLTSPGLTLRQGATQTVRIRDVSLAVTSDNLQELVTLALRGHVEQPDADNQRLGRLRSDTTITGLFDADHRLAWSEARLRTDTQLDGMPVALADLFLKMEGYLLAGMGPTANIRIHATHNEPQGDNVRVRLDSRLAEIELPLILREQIGLSADAASQLQVTAKLSQMLLKRVHPLLNEAVSSDKPIRLSIKQENLVIPRGEFDIRKVRAEGELELGTLYFKDAGLINLIRGLLRRDTSRRPAAVFSPAKLTLQDGVLHIDNLNMTLDNLHLGLSGKADQVTGKVDLTMSIAGETLRRAFGVRSIGPNVSLNVPITGTFDKPEIDTGRFLVEVATLTGRDQLIRGMGAEGALVGEVLNRLFGSPPAEPSPEPAVEEPAQRPRQRQQQQQQQQQKQEDDARTEEETPLSPLDLLRRAIEGQRQ